VSDLRKCAWLMLLIVPAACERTPRTTAIPDKEIEDRLKSVRCRLSDGEVSCQGENTWGLIRDPAKPGVVTEWTRIPIPEQVVALDLSVLGRFACAVGDGGHAYCWGDATDGHLGNGEAPPDSLTDGAGARPRPQRVLELDDAIDVRTGLVHACALTKAGDVSCWGWAGYYSQLGVEDGRTSTAIPIVILRGGVHEIAIAAVQTCARSASAVICWGGYLPDANGRPHLARVPTPIAGTDDATALVADHVRMCIKRRARPDLCWNALPDDAPPPS